MSILRMDAIVSYWAKMYTSVSLDKNKKKSV